MSSIRSTLKDVAREAGVHISTASRALNPSTAFIVHPVTVERVAEAARKLGYRPHPLARGLRTNRTMSVGVIIPDVENPLFGPIIAGIESVLVEDGYSVLIGNADRGPNHADSLVEDMLERHVDGLILATPGRVVSDTARQAQRDVSMVLVNRSVDDDTIPAIVGDDHAGIGLAVRHLRELGHERIGHVAGPEWVSTGRGRRDGFLAWMSTVGLEADIDLVEEAEWYQVEPGTTAALALLGRHPDLTAIVAANDLLGLGCYRAVRSLGKVIGVDVSITGYNDMPLLDLMQPSLTAVRVPYRRMGVDAATTLLALIAGDDVSPGRVLLSPTLAIRSSTGPPADRG
ncbi:MAG TPA: LacI family DNA-binding transcriptional regulator [Acidimicrobiia bacterium]|nr:LacI family DNA-binding transcriptional regulator [Acidimicrobiia bacterium]